MHSRTPPGPRSGRIAAVAGDLEAAAVRLYTGFLRRTHLSQPSELTNIVVEELVSVLGAGDVVLFLVNREETALVPVPSTSSPHRTEQLIEATMAGRCFIAMTILAVATEPGRQRIWVPVIDGTDRIGVL